MDLVIHLGLHKTGTTSLQRDVFARRDLGFHAEGGGQSRLATDVFVTVDPLSFSSEEARRAFAPHLEEATRRGLVPVISQEALSSIPEQRLYHFPFVVDRLVETFGAFRAVLTIREQRSMLLAIYRQGVRSHHPYGLAEALGTGAEASGWSPVIRPEYLLYDRMVDYLDRRLGAERICVLPLEWMRRDARGYLAHLLRFTGVAGAPDDIALTEQNRGSSAVATELARRLVWLGRPRVSSPKRSAAYKLKLRLLGLVDRASPAWASRAIDRRWKRIVDERVAGLYGVSNRRLAVRTGLPLGEWGYEMEPSQERIDS